MAEYERITGACKDDGKVVIIGSSQIQNTLLLDFLRQALDIECVVFDSVEKYFDSVIGCDALRLLFLLDGSSSHIHNTIIQACHYKSLNIFFAVINVVSVEERDEIASWPIVSGIFPVDCSQTQLVRGVRAILDGEVWLPRNLLIKFIEHGRHAPLGACKFDGIDLTRREIEILKCMESGARNVDIATSLSVSPNTVKSHVYNIFRKINAGNRMEAVNWAKQNMFL